jgi:hypothetical protein
MKKYPDFWSVLLGNGPHGFFFGYITVAIIAAIGIILVMASQKYKKNPDSPDKWSWRYFWANNAGNFGACLFLVPIAIRLCVEFIDDPKWMLLLSIGVGFGFYRLAKVANDYGIWTTDKISDKISEKIKQENKP